MKTYKEIDSLYDFEAWQGGEDTKNAIIEAGKDEEFMQLVEELFPDGASETELNDYLWFDRDNIYEILGLDENGEEPSWDEETEDNEDE